MAFQEFFRRRHKYNTNFVYEDKLKLLKLKNPHIEFKMRDFLVSRHIAKNKNLFLRKIFLLEHFCDFSLNDNERTKTTLFRKFGITKKKQENISVTRPSIL